MREYFTITVSSINNEPLEFPQVLNFFCDEVIPLFPSQVRWFDIPNECIHVMEVFAFEQGGQIFGTQQVKNRNEWRQYINANCKCCPEKTTCDVTYNGCKVTYNGCAVTINCSLCN